MAVTSQKSDQYTNVTATPRVKQDAHAMSGKVRIAYVTHTQSGAGDATSDVALFKLPAGKVRLLGAMSHVYVNWTTGSATIDIGWAAYTDIDGTAVAASIDGIDNGVSVDTAGAITLGSELTATGYTKVFESQDGVVIMAASTDAAIADADTLAGTIAYAVE